MLTTGKAVKVTLYLSDGAKHHGVPVYTSILDFLFHSGIAGATVVKGVAGFGSAHRIHSAQFSRSQTICPSRSSSSRRAKRSMRSCPSWKSATGSGLIEIQETIDRRSSERTDARLGKEPTLDLDCFQNWLPNDLYS